MGLRLFFLPNFPGTMFIQGATFIPDSRVIDPPYCLTFQRPCSVFRAIGAPMHLHYIQSYIVDVATRRQWQSVAHRGGGGSGCGGCGAGRLKNNSACHSCLEKVEVNWSTQYQLSKACNLEACFLDDRTFIKLRKKTHLLLILDISWSFEIQFFLTFEKEIQIDIKQSRMLF